MKRAAAFLFSLALSTAVFAAEPTYPVMVGLKHTGPLSVKSLAVSFDPTEPGRDFQRFTIVNAFAAKLTASEIAELRKSPSVLYVEEDVERRAMQLSATATTPLPQLTPYGVDLIRAPQAWVAGKGANVNVVVVDTGIDFRHPDLASQYAGGLNTFDANAEPKDDNGHGTHVAGTIGALDNDLGVVGVAPNVRLWAVKVLDENGSGRSSATVRAVNWVVDKKAALGGNWIISLSLGSCQASNTERAAFEKAINAGVMIVAAAGNHDPSRPDSCGGTDSNSYSVSYPAAYDGVIAVAAVDSLSNVASFSNFGPEVALSAPGVSVLSTFPTGTGEWSVMIPQGGAPVLAPPVHGSPARDITGPYVFCGFGGSASDFPPSVKGKIALISRGNKVTFHNKALNAKNAGAAAVVIFNNDTSAINWTLLGLVDSTGQKNVAVCEDSNSPTYNPSSCHDDPADVAIDWPLTVGISKAEGEKLVNAPKDAITVAFRQKDDYAIESGTSMSCPHVTGAAAALWSMAPGATPERIKQVLIQTAHDLGDPGVDNKYGNGLIDVEAAGRLLNPAAFGNGAGQPPTKPTGRTPGRRGH